MKYKSKIDWWIGLSILAGMVLPIIGALTSRASWAYAVPPAIWILVLGFLYPQSYETTRDALVIRAGLTRRTIPYSSITAVRPSSDTRSSLAMSLDRVLIEHASGELLISPDDQDAFFRDLESHAPQLTRRGQDLVIAIG